MHLPISPPRRLLTAMVTGILALSAILYLAFLIRLALGSDDAGRFETTLAMSVSSQFDHGPGHLYGPYTATNHLVLIHAPLYYRLAALLAWPLIGLNVPALTASFVAGRLISIVATLWCLLSAYRLGCLGGLPKRAGFLAVCLIAAAPIPGLLAVMTRPDMLAVALQTAGIFLVLRSINNHFDRSIDLTSAYLLFAVAFCVKQNSLIALAVSSTLLIVICMKEHKPRRAVIKAHLAAAGVVFMDMGIEEYVTTGNMSLSVFILPSGPFRQINRASWAHVGGVLLTIVKKLCGLLAMVLGCALGLRAETRGTRVDYLIALYLLAELAAFVPLCLNNKGSADNYVLQSVVLASILAGRAAQRILDDANLPAWRLATIAIAPFVVLARDAQLIELAVTSQNREHAVVSSLLTKTDLSTAAPDQIYFVDRLDLNRRYGNTALIHDEWLYGAFEQVGVAEPRSRWLRSTLASGAIRYVIMPNASTRLPGLDQSLPELGFRKVGQIGDYHVWNAGGSTSVSSLRTSRPSANL